MSELDDNFDDFDDFEGILDRRGDQEIEPEHYLTGQLLIAMPQMGDPRFEHAVVYVCAHNDGGAMGIMLNKEHESVSLYDMLEQLDIQPSGGLITAKDRNIVVNGGPVENNRGFVLHTSDYAHDGTIDVGNDLGLTASVDILKAISEGQGPQGYVVALGYAAWDAGQLEDEFQENVWLAVPSDDAILFTLDRAKLWNAAIGKLGVDPGRLHDTVGNA